MSDLAQLFASSLPIEVKPSKPKYAFLLLVCVAVTAFLVWTLVHRQAQSVWIVTLCAVGSSLGVALCVYALCEKRPLVLLDQHGVTVRGWKGCPVAWGDIERVWKHEQQASAIFSRVEIDWVCMAIRHSKQWHGNQGRLKRTFHSYYSAQGYGDMYFTTKGMNFEADELVAAIQSHIGGLHLAEPPSLVAGAVGS